MTGLILRSFHSVKGGVGKSTLATASAIQLARAHPDDHVLLIDMDLTGTSLADVLPLRAPSWSGAGATIPLDTAPAGWHSVEESRALIHRRNDADDPTLKHVAFLNDYLLYAPQDGDSDADPRGLYWRLEGGDNALPQNLSVLPSSALPRDLRRILPVIFDEYQSAFLEARLEALLARVLSVDPWRDWDEARNLYVIVDVPPTLPGLSSAVMSVLLRLTAPTGIVDLAENAATSPVLRALNSRDGRAFVVVSEDLQDLRAAARWLRPTGDPRVRLVVNRTRQPGSEALQEYLRAKLGGGVLLPLSALDPLADEADASPALDAAADWAPQFASAIPVVESGELHFFDSADGPAAIGAFSWLE